MTMMDLKEDDNDGEMHLVKTTEMLKAKSLVNKMATTKKTTTLTTKKVTTMVMKTAHCLVT